MQSDVLKELDALLSASQIEAGAAFGSFPHGNPQVRFRRLHLENLLEAFGCRSWYLPCQAHLAGSGAASNAAGLRGGLDSCAAGTSGSMNPQD